MSIDSYLPVATFLPVAYDHKLPARYVLYPAESICEGKLKGVDKTNCSDTKESLRYKKDMITGSVKIETMESIDKKGMYVDIIA